MNSWFLIILSFGQNGKFYKRLDASEKKSFLIEAEQASATKIDVIDFDKANYGELLLGGLNIERKRKGRKEFNCDSSYQRMCAVGMAHFSKFYFLNSKYEDRANRYVDFGLRYLGASHRMFRLFMIEVDLVELNDRARYYCNRRDQTTDLQLFYGKKSYLSPEHEDYKEPVPVQPITEHLFVSQFLKAIKRENGLREIHSKMYDQIGVSVKLDESSIHKKKIPRAFIMVILGGKQTQNIRIKEPIAVDSDARNNPDILLK